MTPEQCVVLAQGVVADYTTKFPRAKSVMFQRINVRQRELFTAVRAWDREFYGASITATLAGGAVNLTQAFLESEDVYPIESLDVVTILDEGDSDYSPGDEVNVVPADDVAGHLPPRMTFRSMVLQQVGTDLADVTSLTVKYARRSKSIDASGQVEGASDVSLEIDDPFDYLLVWDLARDLVIRTVDIDAATKKAALEIFTSQESGLLSSFEAHVRGMAYAREDRFGG